MYKRAGIALIISGLTTLGVYRYRRGLVSRLLGLPPALHDVAVERGLRIPMPDGVELVADRYRPRQPGGFPTILVRTPYGRKAFGFFVSQRMAERGYNVLVQDVRGRFDSEGDFDVFAGEDADSRATIRWIGNQPWFDGSLGLWGMSYLAYVQWAAAPDAPAFLKAIMPQIGGSRAYPIIYPDGAFNLDLALPYSILLEEQNTSPGASFLKSFFKSLLLQLRLRRRLRSGFMHLPVGKVDAEVSGRPKTSYRDWLAHPRVSDAYWRDRDYSRRVHEVEAPARLFSGWYDFFLRELLDDYEALAAAGKTPHLTVGPYPHGSLGMMGEILRETFAWFDQHLKGETGRTLTKPVRLELYAESSLEHADFFGRLCDVRPDGKSINVCDGLFRLEPSQGKPQPDGSSRIEIDMWATAYRFQRDHSIRLQVSSGAHPRWNRNLGTGEPTATATTMLAAAQTIYHDREHPSRVILPVNAST
jgi:uncharacterized protein